MIRLRREEDATRTRRPTPNEIQDGGADRNRTCDLLIANETLCQLSYDPIHFTYKHLRSICSDRTIIATPYALGMGEVTQTPRRSTRQLLGKIPHFPSLYRHVLNGTYYAIKITAGKRKEHSLNTSTNLARPIRGSSAA